MSTLAYARLTTRRDATPVAARKGADTEGEAAQSVGTYVDAMAALVPAEVLGLHAIILSFTTTTETDATSGNSVTTITEPSTLAWTFWGLVLMSALLFVVPRLASAKKFEEVLSNKLDWLRALVPPGAFVVWTMLQKATAFDALGLGIADQGARTVIALFAAVLLGLLATTLSKKADENDPGGG